MYRNTTDLIKKLYIKLENKFTYITETMYHLENGTGSHKTFHILYLLASSSVTINSLHLALECQIIQVTAASSLLRWFAMSTGKQLQIFRCNMVPSSWDWSKWKTHQELRSFKTPVTLQQSTWCNITEDATVHQRGCHNLPVCHAHTTGDKSTKR